MEKMLYAVTAVIFLDGAVRKRCLNVQDVDVDWSGMSLVSINDVLKITTKVEKIHPYKVVGDRDSYSPYNEGWSDCVSLIEHYLEQIPPVEPEQGKWSNYKDEHGCSVCHSVVIQEDWDDDIRYNYCPYCGAEMRDEL